MHGLINMENDFDIQEFFDEINLDINAEEYDMKMCEYCQEWGYNYDELLQVVGSLMPSVLTPSSLEFTDAEISEMIEEDIDCYESVVYSAYERPY